MVALSGGAFVGAREPGTRKRDRDAQSSMRLSRGCKPTRLASGITSGCEDQGMAGVLRHIDRDHPRGRRSQRLPRCRCPKGTQVTKTEQRTPQQVLAELEAVRKATEACDTKTLNA